MCGSGPLPDRMVNGGKEAGLSVLLFSDSEYSMHEELCGVRTYVQKPLQCKKL